MQYSTATASTPTVTNTNSGALKTAIFTLSDAAIRGAQAGGMDFRVYNGGSTDVVVRSVPRDPRRRVNPFQHGADRGHTPSVTLWSVA
ncbi:hypothetical protein ACQPZF_26630 [Actinosynnema sp. CS-041913]|uniref:hypothetical protein n=1 Tax=Actinosynnema sp. CS-041913 TaxID=3239917 RepID=UPI003D8E3653